MMPKQSITFGRMALGFGSSLFKINDGVVGQSRYIFTGVDIFVGNFYSASRELYDY